jgi:hypothetical protein
MRRSRALLAAAVLCLLGGAAIALAAMRPVATGPGPAAPRADGQEPAPAAAAAVVPLTPHEVGASHGQVDLRHMLELPDGTFVPALNGAVGAGSLREVWKGAWSPIVGAERSDQGVDWYVHADGSRSTTEMKYRPDLHRFDAMTRLARPLPAAPAPRQPWN